MHCYCEGMYFFEDTEFITAFVERMANAKQCPVLREMPEKMKEKWSPGLFSLREKALSKYEKGNIGGEIKNWYSKLSIKKI